MSSGNSIRRGGISVSAYLENLNALPPADERIDDFNPADLDLWTNTQFFDFDPINQVRPEKEQQQAQQQHTEDALSIDTGMKNGGNFDHFLDEFNEFENFDYSPTFDGFNSSSTAQQTATPVQQVMPAPAPQSPALISTFASTNTPAPAPAPSAPASNARGSKRKASVSVASPGSLEEASRLAAEEDKRRRNTAASARFRVKKKQKEQQLEKTAKEMTDRVHQLEQRIQQLELENKWLKGLIVEKNGGKAGEEMMMPPSMLNDNKDGVGTTSSDSNNLKQEV